LLEIILPFTFRTLRNLIQRTEAEGAIGAKKIGPLKGARSLGGINLPHAMLLEAFGAGLTNNPFERGQNLPGYSIFFDPQLTNA